VEDGEVHEESRTKRRAATAVAATAAIGSMGASGALAESALANHPRDTCPGNTICEWQDANFAGGVKWWASNSRIDNYRGLHYDSAQSVLLDPGNPFGSGSSGISSVWNNTGRWVTLCNAPTCSATGPDTEFGVCLGPDKAINYLGDWNDVLSAHRTGTAADHCAAYGSQEGCSL